MAVGKFKMYELAKLAILKGEVDLSSDTLKAAIFLSTSNANTLSGHNQLSDLNNEHASNNGYARQTLTNVTVTNNAGVITVDADNIAFAASGGSIVGRLLVIFDDTHADDIPLFVCLMDTAPADKTVTDGNTMTIQIHADGIVAASGADSDS